MKIRRGFTLIELLIFIMALGIMANILALAYGTLFKSSRVTNQQQTAINAAVQCMEWYLGQNAINGFAAVLNSTTPPNFCTKHHDYAITFNVAKIKINGDDNFAIITINVANAGNATLSTIIADY